MVAKWLLVKAWHARLFLIVSGCLGTMRHLTRSVCKLNAFD